MKSLLICSINQNLHESLSSFLDTNFIIHCCFPSVEPGSSVKKHNPDICFFDREVVSDEDIKLITDLKNTRKNIHIILAYFYYDATSMPENKISSIVDNVILKPYQFDKLINKINSLAE